MISPMIKQSIQSTSLSANIHRTTDTTKSRVPAKQKSIPLTPLSSSVANRYSNVCSGKKVISNSHTFWIFPRHFTIESRMNRSIWNSQICCNFKARDFFSFHLSPKIINFYRAQLFHLLQIAQLCNSYLCCIALLRKCQHIICRILQFCVYFFSAIL